MVIYKEECNILIQTVQSVSTKLMKWKHFAKFTDVKIFNICHPWACSMWCWFFRADYFLSCEIVSMCMKLFAIFPNCIVSKVTDLQILQTRIAPHNVLPQSWPLVTSKDCINQAQKAECFSFRALDIGSKKQFKFLKFVLDTHCIMLQLCCLEEKELEKDC